jgi:signal transduction histidine kinase/ActR/RegA family two-component response regulator
MNHVEIDSPMDLLRHQTTLARFGELALNSDSLLEILTEACRLAGEALGTDLAKVVELEADGKTLRVRAGVGWDPHIIGRFTTMVEENTAEYHAFITGEPVISPDIRTETRFRFPEFLIEHGVRSAANVIIIGGQGKPPFGVLQIDSRVPREFTEADTLFLRSYANLVAAAVQRIRAVAEMRSMLEGKVEERTRELVEANDKLHVEAEERARIEETLRQSLKMEAVGQLTGGLAHDFNNMLAGISGSLELMTERISQGRTRELGRYIEMASISVSRAAALTHRLLAFSRRQTLDPKPTDVNALITGMQNLLIGTLGPGIQIEARLAPDLWPILCDPNQLENALLNLALNARDAMPDGGSLMIETTNAVIPDRRSGTVNLAAMKAPAGEYVGLFVTDTGTGMSPNVLTRAFDPFFTTKPAGQGTGLGLSMTYGFVQQSGGYVLLTSKVGEGAMVSIYLPRHFEAAERVAEVDVMSMPQRVEPGAVVLLVEDEVTVRMLVAEALTDLGYTVLEVGTGQSGLVIAQSRARIDLLLTDVGLPGGMNGRQLADAARGLRPGLKVLFLTGYAESIAMRNARMENGIEVMTKPFALNTLAAKVQRMIRSQESNAA